MNRAERRRAARQAKNAVQTYPRCPWCGVRAAIIAEVCLDGCCPTSQSCASCGVPR